MLELGRTVRFCLNDDGQPAGPATNTFAAWPAMRGLGRYYEIHVTCAGEADALTGYFINIKEIDSAVRDHALPILQDVLHRGSASSDVSMGTLLFDLLRAVQPALHESVQSLQLRLTPYHSLEIWSHDVSYVTIRQQFEFSAAHRLHVDAMSADENRAVFGKCNNPAGHGHNYKVEVAVRCAINEGGRLPPVESLDAIVDDAVIAKLDHKNLNMDVPEFADLNPSVEHIAKVIFDMLLPRLDEQGMTLDEIRVWETGKTVCSYRGELV